LLLVVVVVVTEVVLAVEVVLVDCYQALG